MSAKKKPRKPSQNLGHVVFPQKILVREDLPDFKDELETVIVKKFIGSLRHFAERHLSQPVKSDPWPDFLCEEKGTTIGIELVEVINVEHAHKRYIQKEYELYIRNLVADLFPRLSGLQIIFNDGYQEPPYHPLRKAAGRSLAQTIAYNLHSVLDQIENIPLNHISVYSWQKNPNHPITGAIVRRVAPKDARLPAVLGFFGCFPENVSVIESLLSRTIKHKVAKKYPEFKEGQLILLAYEDVSCSVEDPNSIAANLARKVLKSNIHPFDEVWYIFPYAAKKLGHIIQIWP